MVSNSRFYTRISETYLDTLALRQTDPRLLLTNDEHISLSSSELVVDGILDVDNSETTIVSLSVSDDTNTTHIATTSDHSDHTCVELDVLCDLASSQVDLDSVVDLDDRVWVSDTISSSASLIFIFPTKHWSNV